MKGCLRLFIEMDDNSVAANNMKYRMRAKNERELMKIINKLNEQGMGGKVQAMTINLRCHDS